MPTLTPTVEYRDLIAPVANANCTGEMLRIVLLVALFLSNHKFIIGGSGSNTSLALGVTAGSLYFLADAADAFHVSLYGISIGMIASLYETYVEAGLVIFIVYLAMISVGSLMFLMALRDRGSVATGTTSTKLFNITCSVLKHLLDNGIITIDDNSTPAVLRHVHEALFTASFMLSIMSLWLQAAGISLLNPMRRASYSLRPSNRPSLIASVLYWMGAALAIAYVVVTIVLSSAGTPTIIKVACGVFAFCAAGAFLKQCRGSVQA